MAENPSGRVHRRRRRPRHRREDLDPPRRAAYHPCGEIQHVTNHSHDWVIMKLQFRVPYDIDLVKVKKIFKKFGAEMQADPVMGPNLLDPPRSQGVLEMETQR